MGLALISVLAAAAAAAVPAGAPDAADGAAAACRDLAAHADDLGSIPLRRLDELPPGQVTYAVYRVVRGCPVAEVLVSGRTYYVPSIVRREQRPTVGSRIVRRDRPGQ